MKIKVKNIALCIIFNFIWIFSIGQNTSFSLGSQIPLKYDIGFEYKIIPKISSNLNFGILSKPFDKAILGIIHAFGLEEGYIQMIENSFKLGLVTDLGVRFQFKKNYIGIFGQNIFMFAQDTPNELVESFLNIDLNNFKKTKIGSKIDLEVKLQSNLFQFGLLYGRRFELKNPKHEIRTEFFLSANIFSNSKFFIEDRKNEELTQLINKELKPIYKDYTYIPTINVYYVFKF
ncbi:MAG: hypothetical protein HYU67_09025 [Flavobacteriia bacterium]|nr:hypothetical protein [Flavobacteriia bacterium]